MGSNPTPSASAQKRRPPRLRTEGIDRKNAERAWFRIVEPARFKCFACSNDSKRQCRLTVIAAARQLHESGEHSGLVPTENVVTS